MTNHEKLKEISIDDFALFLAGERLNMIEPVMKRMGKEIPPHLPLWCAMKIRSWLEAEVAEKESEDSNND